jgi:hypothetical protein
MGVGADQRDLHRLVRSTIADPASELSAYRPDRAAGLDERTSSQPPKRSGFCSRGWLRGSEKGSGCKRAIRARDVRAADLQEEPTKPAESRAHSPTTRFGGPTKTVATGEHRSERSEPSDTASAASGAIKRVGSAAVVVPRKRRCATGKSWQRMVNESFRSPRVACGTSHGV